MRDRDVRVAVRQLLTQSHGNDADTIVVEEMGVWQNSVRIDMAVINGKLSGFEFKSDKDTLDRLPLQANLYSKVFNEVTLVAGGRHLDKAIQMVPSWWGVIRATNNNRALTLEDIRQPLPNPDQDPFLLACLLWKNEALDVLSMHGLARGWRSKRLKEIHTRLAASIPSDQLNESVRQKLKSRPNWLRQNRADELDMPINAD